MTDVEKLKAQLIEAEAKLVADFQEQYKVGQLFKINDLVFILANGMYEGSEKMLLQVAVAVRDTSASLSNSSRFLRAMYIDADMVSKLEPVKNLKEAFDLESTRPKYGTVLK